MGQGDVEYLVVSVFVSSATDNTQRSFSENLIDLLNDPSCQEITVTQTNTCEVESACNTIRSYTCSCLDKGKKQYITFCCLDRSTREVIDIRKTGELADRKVLLSVLLRGKTSIPTSSSGRAGSQVLPQRPWLTSKSGLPSISNPHSAYLWYQSLCGTWSRMMKHTSLWLLWNPATSSALALALIHNTRHCLRVLLVIFTWTRVKMATYNNRN